ncbi:MAG: glycogen synthase GlgA [Faecalibacterium sp.]|nr:glycogen synthase GlgA [Ruminococcus sp.]MCM1391322.1 glycogen synthase GlgA [Ruminococcus sp.]MCM1484881.1 glycogen synthase GlgA [Faecalibacterium sp.]
MKVLYVASEAQPFMASGGLGDVAGSLPQALRRRLIGCRVVMPLYDTIKQELKDTMTFVTSISVPVAWRRQYCGIFQAKYKGVIYYLIDNQYYFKRDSIYGHFDDAERFTFFSRAVLEMLPHIDFKPDVIHCNDWQSALTPVFYTTMYAKDPWYQGIKTVFTIHNIQYQGTYGMDLVGDVIGLKPEDAGIVEYDGDVNFMKGAIECADKVTTVSPSYADEILDPWYSHGLDTILRARQWKLQGILNGIDIESYNPETDSSLEVNYNAETVFEGKKANKRLLQENMGLPVRDDVPVIGLVSRLVSHKGLDLIKAVFDEFLSTTDAQVVVVGSGDWQYENYFRELTNKYHDKIAVRIGFVPSLARKIYAGADLFLMPSKSEPCGLSQMVALRYGTVPIVRETGGLRDSITDSGDGEGNGFTFKTYNAHDMLGAIHRGLGAYWNREYWPTLVERAMACDFSWGRSANEYIKMYKQILKD